MLEIKEIYTYIYDNDYFHCDPEDFHYPALVLEFVIFQFLQTYLAYAQQAGRILASSANNGFLCQWPSIDNGQSTHFCFRRAFLDNAGHQQDRCNDHIEIKKVAITNSN